MSKLILLVEDNEDDAFIMQTALKKAGVTHSVFLAEDGRTALDYVEGRGNFADRAEFPLPAIVLLDLKLPKLMGLEVLKAMRANPALPAMLVIILTASDQDADIERAYRLGANSYLVKPLTVEKMVALSKCLGEYWLEWNVAPRLGKS